MQAKQVGTKRLVVERLVMDPGVDLEEELGMEDLAVGMMIVLACIGSVEVVAEQRILPVYMGYLVEVVACPLEVAAAWIQVAPGRSLDLLVQGQGCIDWMAVDQMVTHYKEMLL